MIFSPCFSDFITQHLAVNASSGFIQLIKRAHLIFEISWRLQFCEIEFRILECHENCVTNKRMPFEGFIKRSIL
ncbi:unnamed protein product [Heterobilharzia americana]|nr:unnamed protein product [Heterobilharzia americana]